MDEENCGTCRNWVRTHNKGKSIDRCGTRHYTNGTGRLRCKSDHTCESWKQDTREYPDDLEG